MVRQIKHSTWLHDQPPGSTDWMGRGACRSVTSVMFPTRTTTDGRKVCDEAYADAVEAARRYCEICVVKTPCLDYALHVSAQIQLDGIWAGTTPEERAEQLGVEMVYNPKPIPLRDCGTAAGERRHRRHNEPVCDECRKYVARRKREHRQSKQTEARPKGVDG